MATAPGLSFTLRGASGAASRSLPLMVSVAASGIVFGVLAHRADLSLAEALLMSGLVFAGSAQLVALSMWAVPLPVISLVLAALVVNLRYLLMGAVLHRWLGRLSRLRAYVSLFFLSDETWALSIAAYERGERDGAFLLGSGLPLYGSWLSATALGYLAGATIKNPAAWGLDFALVAVFTALLTGLYRGRGDLVPWTVAAAVAAGAERILPGTWYILLGAAAGTLAGVVRDGR